MRDASARDIADHLEEITAFRSEEKGDEVEFDFQAVGYGKYTKRVPLAGPVGKYAPSKV